MGFNGKPAGFGLKKRQESTANGYHKPSDVTKPDGDLSDAVQDCLRLADEPKMPSSRATAEFKVIPEASGKAGK